MNIYLDVDGTIINNDGKEANGLRPFLIDGFKNHTFYWLTTRCRDYDNSSVLAYLKPILQKETYILIKKIKPTSWKTLKTEAINFEESFVWFDDYLLEAEKKILKDNGVFKSWIEVDLLKTNFINYSL